MITIYDVYFFFFHPSGYTKDWHDFMMDGMLSIDA